MVNTRLKSQEQLGLTITLVFLLIDQRLRFLCAGLQNLSLFRIALACVIFVASSLPPAQAQQRIVPWSDLYINKQFDWVVYLSVDKIDRFLKYPGSTINGGITRVLVDYRIAPRPRNMMLSMDRVKYEDLWYNDDKAIGCRRYIDLGIPTNEQGCIYIQPDPLVDTSLKPLSNTVARLILELYFRKCIVTSIVVPKDSFNNFAAALGQLSFYRLDVAVPGGPGENMSVHVLTDPLGLERYFYYDDTGRRNPANY